MDTPNWKIFLAIFFSLLIFFGGNYLYKNYQSIKPPDFPYFKNLFTFKLFNPANNQAMNQWNNGNNSFTLPTPPLLPTNRSRGFINETPTSTLRTTAPVVQRPSATPRPTAKPQPTATPRPQPTATPAPQPITSDVRPGTTLEEIFEEVNKRICVPAALLRAFQEAESGAWVEYNSFNPAPYNTYGWWKTTGPDPCKGVGYDETTGYTFPDMAVQKKCANPLSTNPGQTGIFSINQWEQETSRKNTIEFLPNNIDRRVIFDAAIIFASATINRVVEPECGEVWSDDVVNTAAAKHVSGQYPCTNTTCEQYSNDILSLYKKYR